jgi:hypothetical protein
LVPSAQARLTPLRDTPAVSFVVISEVLRLAVTHKLAIWRAIGLAFGSTLLFGVAALVGQITPTAGGDSRIASADLPLNPPMPMMLLAGGSLAADGISGLVANELPTARQLGQVTIGGPSQGSALAVSPDGRRAFLLDTTWLVDQQRPEWRLNELELPSLRGLGRARYSVWISLLGQATIVAVARDGAEVYVETMRITGPSRFDPQLRVGQPESEYGIAVYDVARGAFSRSMTLPGPWCGVAELSALPDGRLAALCPTAHQVRLLDPRTGQQVGSVSVSGEKGALSPDGSKLWVVTSSGQLQEVDLVRGVIGRTVSLPAAGETCAPCVPLQRLHVSTDGRTLFVPATPGAPELRGTGRASVVWTVDTSTLQRVATVPLPEPVFDSAPSPDGSALLVSTVVSPPDRQTSWLLAVPSGRALVKWPRSVCCLYVLPTPAPQRRAGSETAHPRAAWGPTSALTYAGRAPVHRAASST